MKNKKYWMIAMSMLIGISCLHPAKAQDADASANTNACKDLNPPQDPDGDYFLAMSGQDNYEKDQAQKYGSAYTSPLQGRADRICAYFGCPAGASFTDYGCYQTPRGNYSLASVDAQGNISVDSYSPFTPRGISWGAPPIYTVCAFSRIVCKSQPAQTSSVPPLNQDAIKAVADQLVSPNSKGMDEAPGNIGVDPTTGDVVIDEGNGLEIDTTDDSVQVEKVDPWEDD